LSYLLVTRQTYEEIYTNANIFGVNLYIVTLFFLINLIIPDYTEPPIPVETEPLNQLLTGPFL